MAIGRVVQPELLDDLPVHDPGAIRSRRDLRAINALMGNFSWVRRQLVENHALTSQGIIEIGAGEGILCRKLHSAFPTLPITGLDLVARPANLPPGVGWREGDLFSELPRTTASVLVGVMIIHHFSDEQLLRLATLLDRFKLVCFCEPWRSRPSLLLGRAMLPFVGHVTRHDMMVSIRAGFLPGELARLLALRGWKTEESVDWRGSIRVVARRA